MMLLRTRSLLEYSMRTDEVARKVDVTSPEDDKDTTCFDCGADRTPGKPFCGDCGREINRRNGGGTRREASAAPRQTFPVPEAVTALKAWTAAKVEQHTQRLHKRNLSVGKVRLACGIVVLLAGIFCWIQTVDAQAPMPVYILGVAVLAFLFSMGLFSSEACSPVPSEEVYYTFPGSRDANGVHQCIFCGARGVHKRTPYKTYSTEADCPKCRKNLWYN